jgi:agmatine deiminase
MRSASPRSLGYRMPAEWEPQHCVWMAWPTNGETWPGDLMGHVRQAYVSMIETLAADQSVGLLVDDNDRGRQVHQMLVARGVADRVRFYSIPTVDTWIRDYGPTFLVDDVRGKSAMADWTFNAWGNKYEELEADNGVPAALNAHLELEMFEAGIVLEGGSIEVNGHGMLLTTEQCLLGPNRNPGFGAAGIEDVLRDFLGVSRVLWLGEGIVGDDTDGHIDDIARFVDPATVIAVSEEDPADENYRILEDNYKRLASATNEEGRPLRVLKLPMPDPVIGPDGRLPASYANFYIGNASVIVPVFGQDKDRIAIDVIQSCFPDRHVVGVDSTAMVHGFGAVHCCTQQQPAVGEV